MRVAIIGSRLFNNYDHFKKCIDETVQNNNIQITEIVSGGAMGADKMAERYASENGIHIDVLKPDYKNLEMIAKYGKEKWGKIAPIMRNTDIIKSCDAVIAFPFSESNGTLDAISKAVKMGKTVYQFNVDNMVEKPTTYLF